MDENKNLKNENGEDFESTVGSRDNEANSNDSFENPPKSGEDAAGFGNGHFSEDGTYHYAREDIPSDGNDYKGSVDGEYFSGDGSYHYTGSDLSSNKENTSQGLGGSFGWRKREEAMPEYVPAPTLKPGRKIFWAVSSVCIALIIIAASIMNSYAVKNPAEPKPNTALDPDAVISVADDNAGSYYSSREVLYNDASRSCATVVCTVKSTNIFGQTVTGTSLGSGFFVTDSGYFVTNSHVVEDTTDIKVKFYDGEEAAAQLVGKDEFCDLAVLKINVAREIIPVTFANSSKARVGEFVMAVGTPSSVDLKGTMTFGVISGKDRRVEITDDYGQAVKTMLLLQTDASINPGNSGGPLFNMKGQVVGINTMKLTTSYEGMGFSIPSSGAVPIINSLITTGKSDGASNDFVKGAVSTGFSCITVDEAEKKAQRLPDDAPDGAMISAISRKCTAYKAGLSSYDIITEIDGKEIKTAEDADEYFKGCSPGQTVTVHAYRASRRGEGQAFTVTFELESAVK